MKEQNDIYTLVGRNLKRLRTEYLKFTQEQLAQDSNLSRSFISQIEGENIKSGVSIATLFYLAQKYDFDIREFFEDYDDFVNENTSEPNH